MCQELITKIPEKPGVGLVRVEPHQPQHRHHDPHFTRTSTGRHHPSAHSTTAIATPWPTSATPTSAASGLDCRWPPGSFLPSLPLPLQSLPKSGVVNFKFLGYSGLRGGRSGQTEVNTRPITGENASLRDVDQAVNLHGLR